MMLYIVYFGNIYTPLTFFLFLSHTHGSSSSQLVFLPLSGFWCFLLWRGVVVVIVVVLVVVIVAVCMCEEMNFIRVTYRNIYKGLSQEHRKLTVAPPLKKMSLPLHQSLTVRDPEGGERSLGDLIKMTALQTEHHGGEH